MILFTAHNQKTIQDATVWVAFLFFGRDPPSIPHRINPLYRAAMTLARDAPVFWCRIKNDQVYVYLGYIPN